jgi:hypothetical protein
MPAQTKNEQRGVNASTPQRRWSKRKTHLLVAVLAVCVLLAARVRIHFGYFSDDRAAAVAAEGKMIRQYNAKDFDAIYDGAADALKSAVPRRQVTDAMKLTFDNFGAVVDDNEAATTCFPNQVRMVRWMKSASGGELTALVTWFVPDGKHAQLVSAQISPGHASFDPAIVRAHSCNPH